MIKSAIESELQRFIDDQVASGAYSTPEDVVLAAMAALRQSEQFGDFAPGELNRLLDKGERSLEREGPVLADEVFEEIRRLSTERRKNRP